MASFSSTRRRLPRLPSGAIFGRRSSFRQDVIVIMRQGLLWLSERQGVFNFVRRNGIARRVAPRFVAGDTAIAHARAPVAEATRAKTPNP